jgi:hypothetical protein
MEAAESCLLTFAIRQCVLVLSSAIPTLKNRINDNYVMTSEACLQESLLACLEESLSIGRRLAVSKVSN